MKITSCFKSQLGPFSVEFACSPCVSGGESRYTGFLPQPECTNFRLVSYFTFRSDVDKVLKVYRIKYPMNVWLNVACSLKHFKWSVRTEKCYINARPFPSHHLFRFPRLHFLLAILFFFNLTHQRSSRVLVNDKLSF